MKCPQCSAPSRVLETRGDRRRRECFNLHRFTTVEYVVKVRRTGVKSVPQ